MVKEIDAPFQGTAYWFLESKWSEWKPYFLLWPRKWNGRWRWLEWVERRASEFTIQYRPTTPNAKVSGAGTAKRPARKAGVVERRVRQTVTMKCEHCGRPAMRRWIICKRCWKMFFEDMLWVM